MLQLALHPEYIEPLCDEIKATVLRDGWTHNALGKMELMDSVLKESQRMKPTDVCECCCFSRNPSCPRHPAHISPQSPCAAS